MENKTSWPKCSRSFQTIIRSFCPTESRLWATKSTRPKSDESCWLWGSTGFLLSTLSQYYDHVYPMTSRTLVDLHIRPLFDMKNAYARACLLVLFPFLIIAIFWIMEYKNRSSVISEPIRCHFVEFSRARWVQEGETNQSEPSRSMAALWRRRREKYIKNT